MALGPHPQRELTLMPRLGFPVLGSARHPSMAAGALPWRCGPPPAANLRWCLASDSHVLGSARHPSAAAALGTPAWPQALFHGASLKPW